MTADEQVIASLKRLEAVTDEVLSRVDKLERSFDRIEGALTLAKLALSIVGLGGIAALIAYAQNSIR